MTTRLETYFSMTYNLGESDTFAKKHIARRFAAFPLIGIEIAELASHIFYAPTDAFAKVSIMSGKKIFSGNPKETWESKWQPLETLKKVAKLFLALLSTLLLGWWAPTWNHTIHEKLGLIPSMAKPAPIIIAATIPPTTSPKTGISIHIQPRANTPVVAKIDTTGSTSSTPISTPVGAMTVAATTTFVATTNADTPVPVITPIVATAIVLAAQPNTLAAVATSIAPAVQSAETDTTAAKVADDKSDLSASVEVVEGGASAVGTADGDPSVKKSLVEEAAGGGTVTPVKPANTSWLGGLFGSNPVNAK